LNAAVKLHPPTIALMCPSGFDDEAPRQQVAPRHRQVRQLIDPVDANFDDVSGLTGWPHRAARPGEAVSGESAWYARREAARPRARLADGHDRGTMSPTAMGRFHRRLEALDGCFSPLHSAWDGDSRGFIQGPVSTARFAAACSLASSVVVTDMLS
jgi:hypothetical protein